VAPQRGSSTWLLNVAPQRGSSTWLLDVAPQRGSSTGLLHGLHSQPASLKLLYGRHLNYLKDYRGSSLEFILAISAGSVHMLLDEASRRRPTRDSMVVAKVQHSTLDPSPSSRLLISSLPPCSVISMPVVNFSPLVWQLCHHQLPVIQTTLVVISVPSKCSNHSDRIWKSSTHLKFQHTTSLFTNLSGIVDDPATSPTLVSLAQPSSAITPSHSLPSVLFTIAIWPVETCRKMSLAAQNEATANFHTIYHFAVIKRELETWGTRQPHSGDLGPQRLEYGG
jgi:hypothetical protein